MQPFSEQFLFEPSTLSKKTPFGPENIAMHDSSVSSFSLRQNKFWWSVSNKEKQNNSLAKVIESFAELVFTRPAGPLFSCFLLLLPSWHVAVIHMGFNQARLCFCRQVVGLCWLHLTSGKIGTTFWDYFERRALTATSTCSIQPSFSGAGGLDADIDSRSPLSCINQASPASS